MPIRTFACIPAVGLPGRAGIEPAKAGPLW
jgi:hypothetical protein